MPIYGCIASVFGLCFLVLCLFCCYLYIHVVFDNCFSVTLPLVSCFVLKEKKASFINPLCHDKSSHDI